MQGFSCFQDGLAVLWVQHMKYNALTICVALEIKTCSLSLSLPHVHVPGPITRSYSCLVSNWCNKFDISSSQPLRKIKSISRGNCGGDYLYVIHNTSLQQQMGKIWFFCVIAAQLEVLYYFIFSSPTSLPPTLSFFWHEIFLCCACWRFQHLILNYIEYHRCAVCLSVCIIACS